MSRTRGSRYLFLVHSPEGVDLRVSISIKGISGGRAASGALVQMGGE